MGYTIHALDEKTWLIEEEAECNVYMYLLAGTERAVLLDTGYGTIPLREIVGSLTDLPITVLCTHGHFDHIGGNGYFSIVKMHLADRRVYQQHKVEFQAANSCTCAPVAPDELDWFDEDLVLDLGERTLEVFGTPGHTMGSVAVLDVERQQLFTGDTCCKAAILLNFDHSSDVATFRNTIRKILEKKEHFDRTWPSHHAKPVGIEIPAQFLEASNLLLEGKAQSTEINNPFGSARMFQYKDISIIY